MRRELWPPGPWDEEPDKLQWVDEATGLQCLIVRNLVGALCGYVGVTEGHPYFFMGYQECEDDIDVHGGLTYASVCQGLVCHEPETGHSGHWWFGFDCSHFGDVCPTLMKYGVEHGVYRDVAYVRQECTDLAAQLAHKGRLAARIRWPRRAPRVRT